MDNKRLHTLLTWHNMAHHAVRRFDFTWHFDPLRKEEDRVLVINFLTPRCKNWVFQLEECPSTKRLHFQGRCMLKDKARVTTIAGDSHKAGMVGSHWSETNCKVGEKDFKYVMKDDSKIEGPWMDESNKLELKAVAPFEIQGITMLPWQKDLCELAKTYDPRTIHILYDRKGGVGKSIFVDWMEFHENAFIPPILNNTKDLLQAVCSYTLDMASMGKQPSEIFIFDFEKTAAGMSQLSQLYRAVESIKNGRIYDTRYKYKAIRLHKRPSVIIMTNVLPPQTFMSQDRWRYWVVCQNELCQYYPTPDDFKRDAKIAQAMGGEVNFAELGPLVDTAVDEANVAAPISPTTEVGPSPGLNPRMVTIPGIKPFWVAPGTGTPVPIATSSVVSPTRLPSGTFN